MSASTSVAELGKALGFSLALGLSLLALLFLALAAGVLDVHDSYRRAERAVAAVRLEILAPTAAAAIAVIAAVSAAAALAAAVATAASAALTSAAAAPAPAALVGAARVDDRLDVADRGRREPD